MGKALVVQDTKVARYDFIFQHGTGRYIDPISVVGDDDDGPLPTRQAVKFCFVSGAEMTAEICVKTQ